MTDKFIPESVKNAVEAHQLSNHRQKMINHSEQVIADRNPRPPTNIETYVALEITHMCKKAHATAVDKCWWDGDRDVPHCLALIHSEVSEALEAYRERGAKEIFHRLSDNKPEGFVYELADILIRVGDLAEHLGLNLDVAVQKKMEFNKKRAYRHGNKNA